MSTKKYNLAKALSWYTIGNILVKSVNFITLRLFTELINTTDYGVFGIYQSYLSIFEMVVLLGTAHTIKMVRYDDSVNYDEYFKSVFYIPIVGTIGLLALTGCYSLFGIQFASLDVKVWTCIFVASGLTAIINLITARLILEGNYKAFILYSIIFTLVNTLFSIYLCVSFFKEANTFWGRIVGNLVALVVSFLFLSRFIRLGKPSKDYIKLGIHYGLPLFVHSIATQILVQSDKIIISQLSTYAAVGIYTTATSLSVIPVTLMSSVESSWSPWFYERLSVNDYQGIKKQNDEIVVGFTIFLVLFIIAAPEVVRIMTSMEYREAIYVLIPLSMAALAELVYLIPLNIELFYKKNKAIWIYTVIAVVFNIAFDALFIYLFGYLAGAYVTFVSRVLLFVMHYCRAKRICDNKFMSMQIVFTCLVLLVFTNLFTIWQLKAIVVRYVVVLVIIVIGIIMMKKKGITGREIVRRIKNE